jgi:hypothetical protein
MPRLAKPLFYVEPISRSGSKNLPQENLLLEAPKMLFLSIFTNFFRLNILFSWKKFIFNFGLIFKKKDLYWFYIG